MRLVVLVALLLPWARPQPTALRKSVAFPRTVLAQFLSDEKRAVPGTRIDSPPFEANDGNCWQVSLYPFGGNGAYADRVGVYLRLLQPKDRSIEVDASMSVTLRCGSSEVVVQQQQATHETQRGLTFRCGITFCPAAEAGSSVGRAEDWGAHLYSSSLLFRELEVFEEANFFVDLEVITWETRTSRRGASLSALLEQTRRLPEGGLRTGEVVVALDRGDPGQPAGLIKPGVEYRVMRLETADGKPCFEHAGVQGAGGGSGGGSSSRRLCGHASVAYLLPTNAEAREGGSFCSNEEGLRRLLGGEEDNEGEAEDAAKIVVEEGLDRTAAAATAAAGQLAASGRMRRRKGREAVLAAEAPTFEPGGTCWPLTVPLDQLPPVASRLGLPALPARLGYAMRMRSRRLLLFLLIGASPLWIGFLASQFVSAYSIPSRSMESTLRVGDVVIAEKLSLRLGLEPEVGDLVLFNPPSRLQQLVKEAGGKPPGSRDLFIKRVAAVGGDSVELLPTGDVAVNGIGRLAPPLACAPEQGSSSANAGDREKGGARGSSSVKTIPQGEVFVLGDCPQRSTDSRSWGPLPIKDVVARPVARIWPVDRAGAIVADEDLNPFRRAVERAQRSSQRLPG
jgi:signal peptidase I